MNPYDAIVIGAGGVGGAAMYHLARRGARVLGLDRFPPGHDRGSSHGQSRIIRQAYFEHADYVPLLRRAYELWPELEAAVGRMLYHEVGLLEVGRPDGAVIPGVLQSAARHGLEIEQLTATEAQRRWPAFRIPAGQVAVFERRAGYLLVEQCVLAHLEAARAAGAELRTGETVVGWSRDGAGVRVETDRATYTTARLIVTAGAWAGALLADLGLPLRVRRKAFFYFENSDPRLTTESDCPTFFFEVADGFFYGFPQLDPRGVKVAEHSGGQPVADPLTVPREPLPEDERRVAEFLQSHLPGVSHRVTDHAVCLYTLTPDEHFVIDRHPETEAVVFAAGLSGHGFKFSGVLGEALADLAISGQTALPIDFLKLDRPALRAD